MDAPATIRMGPGTNLARKVETCPEPSTAAFVTTAMTAALIARVRPEDPAGLGVQIR
jgi:hypothetical protein